MNKNFLLFVEIYIYQCTVRTVVDCEQLQRLFFIFDKFQTHTTIMYNVYIIQCTHSCGSGIQGCHQIQILFRMREKNPDNIINLLDNQDNLPFFYESNVMKFCQGKKKELNTFLITAVAYILPSYIADKLINRMHIFSHTNNNRFIAD